MTNKFYPSEKRIELTGKYTVSENTGENRYSLVITPEGTACITHVSAVFGFEYEKDDRLFLNGYQSWTYSPEAPTDRTDYTARFYPILLNKKFGFTKYSDYEFYRPKNKRGCIHGYTYAYVRRGNRYFLFASLNDTNGFTRIILDAKAGTVTFEKDCSGRKITEDYEALNVFCAAGDRESVFDEWFALTGITPLTDRKVSGYTSWYNRYQDISEGSILSDLESINRLNTKPEIFQIDDGYEAHVGDWLDIDRKKFPDGLEKIVAAIKANGNRPGIWLAPFVCEKDSAVYRDHQDWLLKDGKGNNVFCGGNWSGAYALDFYNPEVREYIKKAFCHFIGIGFELFKLDFLYGVCMIPREDKTRGEIMSEAMDFLREVCGDKPIIGCGVPLASAFGKVEYCRIGPDVSLTYDDVPYMRLFHPERPSTKHTIANTVYRSQLSGRAFINDPDVIVIRDSNTSLTFNQKNMLGMINSLFGGVDFISDNCDEYDDEKKGLFDTYTALQKAGILSVENDGEYIKATFRKAPGEEPETISFIPNDIA